MNGRIYVGDARTDESVGALLACGNPHLDIMAMVDLELIDKYELEGGKPLIAEERHMPVRPLKPLKKNVKCSAFTARPPLRSTRTSSVTTRSSTWPRAARRSPRAWRRGC